MRVVVCGILGRMGRAIVDVASEEGVAVVAGVDLEETTLGEIPVFAGVSNLPAGVDCALDFSSPDGTLSIARWCGKSGIPLVCGTTGLSDAQLSALEEAAQRVPVYYATNMSLAVAFLVDVVGRAASLFDSADAEIVEYHHRRKADAPSGTAMTLAQKILSARGWDEDAVVFGRSGRTGERPAKQLGVHAVRAGNIVGEHHVIFALPEEEIILIHRARDRKLFARGAINAAKWLISQKPGLYSPSDLIAQSLR